MVEEAGGVDKGLFWLCSKLDLVEEGKRACVELAGNTTMTIHG